MPKKGYYYYKTVTKSLFRPLFWGIFLPVNLLSTSICDIPNPQYEIASAEITRNHACWNFWKRMGNCLQRWLVPVFVTLHSAKYWMKAPKLVKTKTSQLKVPVTTTCRKMQYCWKVDRRVYSIYRFSAQLSFNPR